MDNNQFKVFVGGISWDTTEESLKEFMSEAGEVVEAKIIKDKFSGRSKGFGFVTFADEAGMKKAIDELNGKELDGRQLKIAEAQPPKPRE